jgi:hypothetical protein
VQGRWSALPCSEEVGNIHTKRLESIKPSKQKKDLIVEEKRRNQLDARLKEMIMQLDQAEVKRNEPITQFGASNAIGRR